MKKEIVLALADGIATGHHILTDLDIKHDYYSVEICATKRSVADHNAADIKRPVNDIYKTLAWLKESVEIAKSITLVLCGFSCKSLSSQGKRELWDGDSRIFFECVKILNYLKSLNPDIKFLFENVASMPLVCDMRISDELGVQRYELNAGLLSGQARKRKYWFNWSKKEVVDRGLLANRFLDDDGLELIAFTKSNRGYSEEGKAIVEGRTRKDGKAATLMTGLGCGGQSSKNFVITKKMRTRELTVQECLNLQGIPFVDMSIVTPAKAFAAIGDGWQFDAVKEILRWKYENNK